MVHEERLNLVLLNVIRPGDSSRQTSMLRLGQALSHDVNAAIRPRLRVASGPVAETIVRIACAMDADLIVLGSGVAARSVSASPLASVLGLAGISVLVLPRGRARAGVPETKRLARAA